MYVGEVDVDSNGIILFEPTRLEQWLGPIPEGENLFEKFTSTDMGDEALNQGIIVPVLAIDDAGYEVVVRLTSDAEVPFMEAPEVRRNEIYPLQVDQRLVLADLSVLLEWEKNTGWIDVTMAPGTYAVTVIGRKRLDAQRHIVEAGYEFQLRPTSKLVACTADTGVNMRVLD